jgi:hypothetical protein
VKSELSPEIDFITTISKAHSKAESDDECEQQTIDFMQASKTNWEVVREHEQQRIKVIKILTEDELVNIEKWLLGLNNIYEELRYPTLFRVHHAATYFQEDEKIFVNN